MRNSRHILVAVVVVVVLAGGVGVVRGAMVIDDPRQLIGANDNRYISMEYLDNLMERIDGNDSVVDKGDGEYYILFGKDVEGGLVFGGYVETDNGYSNNNYSGYEGWCDGHVDRNTFLEGSSPDYAMAIYDPDGGQFALHYANGTLVFDDNLTLWESGGLFPGVGGIEYDGVLGGIVGGLVFDGTDDYRFVRLWGQSAISH